MNNLIDERLPKFIYSQPSTRKSRSISRYFLGTKRSSIDDSIFNPDIHRCLISVGIYDTYDLWTNVTLFRDYTTYRRLFILTNKNELIIGKIHLKQCLFKLKQRIDLNRLWLSTNFNENILAEITSLNYYDLKRSLIMGWPLTENFLVEFDTNIIRDLWKERIESTLRSWWKLNESNLEHVRVVIDQNCQTSFLIRKVISVRADETVRDLIKKCVDAFHLQDPLVDNYVLFVKNNQTNGINHINRNLNTNSTSQSTQITNTPLIVTTRSKSLESLHDQNRQREGHEYPFSIKMKHLKNTNSTLINNRSFDGDDHLSLQNHYNSSSTSLNNVTTTNYHDFELRKREPPLTDNPSKKYRFFHKRKTKTHQHINDEYHSSSSSILISFFGQKLDDLTQKYDQQLPPVIMQLLEILYVKGPETTGIFRKVANTRSVKDCIEKIEHNIPLQDDDLHPILAAGLLKHFLRTLPEPLFNSIQYDNWKKCLRLSTLTEKISFAKKNILSTLPKTNHILLKGCICVLHHISEHADTNGMNPFNLGLCVSNSLFKTESTTITSGKQEADVMSSIVEFLIQNCSTLFGSDIFTCITDKHIIVHQISNLSYPTASSIESLDEVESSPHIPAVNRSHDSGLAASDQPFNDDSSEISEHFRYHQPSIPDWTSSIACGKGVVVTSIFLNPSSNANVSVTRRRSSKNTYKPSKQFLEREKLINNTTDDEEKNSSVRSSSTTIHNITTGKIKRSKSLSRHSSLGSGEHKQQKHLIKEPRRLTTNDVKRTSSLKQFHYSSDDAEDDDDDEHITHSQRNKTNVNQDYIVTSRKPAQQQDLELTKEPLNNISTSTPTRSTSLSLIKTSNISSLSPSNLPVHQEPIIGDSRYRHHTPLKSHTNKISLIPSPNARLQHLGQSILNTQKKSSTERDRIFVHHSNSRPFILSAAIQMKPIDEKYQQQNTLRHKTNEKERQSRTSAPVLTNISRYQSIERRITPSPPIKAFSSDINRELHPSDISWSVKEKAKLFEHKLSTGRENYV